MATALYAQTVRMSAEIPLLSRLGCWRQLSAEFALTKNKCVIVGCGTMGCDIAAIFISAGWEVEATSRNVEKWPELKQKIGKAVSQLEGQIDLDKLNLTSSLEKVDWPNARFVLESVPENFDLKRDVFRQLDKLVPETVPVLTNTSGMRVSEISADCATRHRMAGLHFFLPAHLVPAVEVVRGENTEKWVVEQAAECIKAVGRVPINVSKDCPGFLANRIQHALMREAFAIIDEGLGTADDVDAAVKYGFGFRYVAAGPILQKELSGLDTQLAAARSIYPSLTTSPEPSHVLEKLVGEGRLGTKTGKGFWDWTPEAVSRERARMEEVLISAAKLLGGLPNGKQNGA